MACLLLCTGDCDTLYMDDLIVSLQGDKAVTGDSFLSPAFAPDVVKIRLFHC